LALLHNDTVFMLICGGFPLHQPQERWKIPDGQLT